LVVAAIKILPQVGRVLIFDGDAHHGDGTDDCIERTSRQSQIVNVSRQHFGRKIQHSWDSRMWYQFAVDLIREFLPGIIFYQAGADAWEKDPYMCGYLTKEGMAHRDRGIFQACKELAIPVVWNLAGGYSDPMQDTIDIHLQTLQVSDEVFYAG
jgi:acetoin utilization deacetylase AcuC-like enzyme